MLLKDKVVVISGVGPGMGQAMARIAAAEGAKVVLAARNKDFLEQVCDEIAAAGGTAIAVPCDIADADQCKALAKAAADAFGGRIDGLVNSAYYHGDWSFIENSDEDDWAKIFDVSCLGTLRLTKACVPYLKDGGAVVNVSTMATVRPYGTEHGMEMGYAVTKGGINVLTKYMATDLGRYGIRVNTCRMGWIHGAPVQGFIDSEVAQGRKEEDVVGAITKDIPLGKIPPEDDCARAVLMMISDYSAVVTGAALDVNGGHWMAP
ncbi:MAG: SDR family oxidoreductase [Novosphingobium sp.]|nr:SDR family oxidoreductase [Novosphingobium sp.]